MNDRENKRNISFPERVKEKISMLFSIGALILNLLTFALFIRESATVSLILAGAFLSYIPFSLFDDQEGFLMWCVRIAEILASLFVTLAYILLFAKLWLLILPIIEIAGVILFYIFVYRRNYW